VRLLLSFDTTQNDLQDAFSAHGTVVDANPITDRVTGRSRGFGFVTMSNDDEAEAAIGAMNNSELKGRALKVSEARAREERPAAAGNFRGRNSRR
jgi:cold-inducible RNA-binding protein